MAKTIVYDIIGDISFESLTPIKTNILEEISTFYKSSNNKLRIVFLINSWGGDIEETIKFIEFLKHIENNYKNVVIVTVGLGEVLSAAALLLMSGSKGERYAIETCDIMFHDIRLSYPDENETNIYDVQTFYESFVELNDKYYNLLDRYGKKNKLILRGKDNHILPEDAIELNIIDKILPYHEVGALIKKNKAC